MCKLSTYGVSYDGYADRIIDNINFQSQTVYSLTTQNTIFALTSKGTYTICGYTLTRTEHPKLIIYETILDIKVFLK